MVILLNTIKKNSSMNNKKQMLKNISEIDEIILRKTYSKQKYGIDKKTIIKALDKICNDKTFTEKKFTDILSAYDCLLSTMNKVYHYYNSVAEINYFYNVVISKTGNDLIDSLMTWIKMNLSSYHMPWLLQSVCKDLRLGINPITINKIFSEQNKELLPVFNLQFAKPLNSIEELKDSTEDYIVEEKFDGIRLVCVCHKLDGKDLLGNNWKVQLKSRQGLDNTEQFPRIVSSVKKYLSENKVFNTSITFDGELVSRSFNELQTQINLKDGAKDENLKYIIFDITEKDGVDYMNNIDNEKRIEILNCLPKPTELIIISKTFWSMSPDSISNLFKEVLERKGEGLMIKHKKGFYCEIDDKGSIKDRKGWYKLKPVSDIDIKIAGVEPGTGKYANLIGSLICENDEYKFKVGSGMTDTTRKAFTALHEQNKLVGTLIEVQYTEESKGSKGKKIIKKSQIYKSEV